LVLGKPLLNEIGIQQAARSESRSREQVRGKAGERPANPLANRHRKSRFWSLDQGRWHVAVQDVTQYSFSAPSAYQNRTWQPPGKLDNTMIEQRYANLE